MRISNSKKQLAKIIHENGGWHDGAEWAVFGTKSMHVAFIHKDDGRPVYSPSRKAWPVTPSHVVGEFRSTPFANWHQTILSRDEYFHLYPAPVKVVVENKTTCHLTVADKPTIEQLAADYRNAKDYADRKQQEADAAKADAEAKLVELVAAGKALGLVLSVADVPEPELVLSVAPVQKYTGKFYNAELGEAPAYGKNTRDAVCGGCGKRYGEHYGDRCKSGSEG